MSNILEEANAVTKGDRAADYGHPYEDFSKVVGMFNAAFSDRLTAPLLVEEWPLVMQFVKISRQLNSPKRDNLVDGAGYWRTLELINEWKDNCQPDEPKCNCGLATQLVGDGCEVCNPDMAEYLRQQRIEEDDE